MFLLNKAMGNTIRYTTILLFSALLGCTSSEKKTQLEQNFITIPSTQFEWKKNLISLNEFEISDHTVTNLEYKKFIDATNYPAPLHWNNISLPKGKKIIL